MRQLYDRRIVLAVAGTLLAVVIGGALTYFGQTRLDERRAARDRKRDADAAAADFRVAKRLMAEELDTLALHHALLVQERRHPVLVGAAKLFMPLDTWDAYKRALALGLPSADWEALAPFIHAAGRVRLLVAGAEPGTTIDAETLAGVQNGAVLARDLHAMLAGAPAPSVNADGTPVALGAVG
jgi:hypothetical protein